MILRNNESSQKLLHMTPNVIQTAAAPSITLLADHGGRSSLGGPVVSSPSPPLPHKEYGEFASRVPGETWTTAYPSMRGAGRAFLEHCSVSGQSWFRWLRPGKGRGEGRRNSEEAFGSTSYVHSDPASACLTKRGGNDLAVSDGISKWRVETEVRCKVAKLYEYHNLLNSL